MDIHLNNKVVLLTGATSDIGIEITKLLSKSGATVAIHYNKNEVKAKELKKNAGNNSEIFFADLNSLEQTDELFKNVIKHYSKIDILINNAGVYIYSPIEDNESWLENWNKTMNINLDSASLLCKQAIMHFKKNKGGKIINIASRAAFRGDTEDYLAYAASKGGLVSLTRTIARRYGKNNIVAFIVAPGFVKTKMAKDFKEKNGEDGILKELSLKRITEPKDIAPTILFLSSGLMDHSTGSTIDINAGSYIR